VVCALEREEPGAKPEEPEIGVPRPEVAMHDPDKGEPDEDCREIPRHPEQIGDDEQRRRERQYSPGRDEKAGQLNAVGLQMSVEDEDDPAKQAAGAKASERRPEKDEKDPEDSCRHVVLGRDEEDADDKEDDPPGAVRFGIDGIVQVGIDHDKTEPEGDPAVLRHLILPRAHEAEKDAKRDSKHGPHPQKGGVTGRWRKPWQGPRTLFCCMVITAQLS
jgi:hypothetical protein